MEDPPEIKKAAKIASEALLPQKSKKIYNKAFDNFKKWCMDNNVVNITENALLAYFNELSKKFKSSTLWSHYSMIKSTLAINNDIDISKNLKVIAFLKRQGEGYRPKKSKILLREQVVEFIVHAPNETYLMAKVALIFGLAGACRRNELAMLCVNDVQDLGTSLLITIRDTKTKTERVFTVVSNANSEVDFIILCKTYMKLRPHDIEHNRSFINYKNNKCFRQPVGKNTFGKLPEKIATFLNLDNPTEYTGHCFRRSSASLLANAGADMSILKRHGGWKSTSVAEGYVENSLKNKEKIAEKILYIDQPSTSTANTDEQSIYSEPTSKKCNELQASTSQSIIINENNKNINIPVNNTTVPPINISHCSHFSIHFHSK